LSIRMRGEEGDMLVKTSPGRRLEKARIKTYNKQILLLTDMKTHSRFVKWELTVGGKFPKRRYDTIISCIESITNYMALISYASNTYADEDTQQLTEWSAAFRRVMANINPVSHEVVMILTLLSSAIREGRPLPPYMPRPGPFALSKKLEDIDSDLLSVRHVNEPGYAAFAVLQLAARCIGADLETMMNAVKDLVGVQDFSIHLEQSQMSSGATLPLGESGDKQKGD